MTITPNSILNSGILMSAMPSGGGGGGSITFVGSDSTSLNSPPDLTVTLPTHQADDLAIVTVVTDLSSNAISIADATGYTTLFEGAVSNGRARRIGIFYKVLTSSSETNPRADWSGTGEASAAVHVFRGVDTVTPMDATYQSNDQTNTFNMTAPNITTATDNACLFLIHMCTHSDVSGFVGPVGYTDGEETIGTHRNQGIAYLLDAGAAGAKTPGDWQNTGSGLTGESTVYTLALRAA